MVDPTSGPGTGELVPIEDYSRALDEIWRLRRAMAYEASTSAAHGDYKTFPKSRRPELAAQVERMRLASRGGVERAYAGKSSAALRASMLDAGARQTLSRSGWESETGVREDREAF